jgi:uncharacterized delta-60 repeat protein
MKMNKNLRRPFFILLQFILLTCLSVSNAQAAGELDTSFSPALIKSGAGRAAVTAVQPDGKIITYGIFAAVSGVPVTTNVVRLNTDGSLDTTFNAPRINGVASVGEIKLQSTGKIIIVGAFERGIIRLNADGTFDSTFVLSGDFPNITSLNDVEILADDRLVVTGSGYLTRLLPDGASDQTFNRSNPSLWKLAIQADGKILAASTSGILTRYNGDGTIDAAFPSATFNSTVWDIAVQADGKILVAGQFSTLNGFARAKIARLNADGTGDITFNSPFAAGGALFKVIPLPDGKMLVAGRGVSPNTQPLRLNPDGSIDNTFISTIQISAFDLDRLPDGKLIVSGEAAFTNSTVRPMYRLNSDGTADLTFNASFGDAGEGRKIFVQSDGKILVGGNYNYANNLDRPSIARFNADGSVDTGFNLSFFYTPTDTFTAIDVQPDGKILIGALSSTFDALRLNPNGSSDIIFQQTKNVNDIKVLSNGKILIAGNNYLKLFNSNGSLDASFAVNVNGGVQKLAVQPDGKIILVGSFTTVNTIPRGRIARLNADGTLDTSFDTSTGSNNTILDVALQANGQILIGGIFSGFNLTNRPFLARLNADGTLDISFLPNLDGSVATIKIQPNNKILIGGTFTSINTTSRLKLARLNQDGTLDLTLNPGTSTNGAIQDIEFQNDGKILITGQFSNYRGALRFGIARLENSFVNKTIFDYDGDGKADVSIFRPSTNRWYVFKSSDSTVSETTFGVAGDIVAPADYDGDGKTDLGIYRGSSGDWWYLSSINNQQVSVHWGQSGDIPRPSDFDADGKADYVVFRPSNNTWYRFGSTGAVSITPFGLTGDKPVTGDFDGDGKSDLAIYRPSNGNWWYLSSIDNSQKAVQWGISTDVPAPADFDGDGKSDFAVYRPSTGVWYVINSSNGSFTIFQFGVAEDKPVPADYDGDGKADIAVFRPSTGTWYQQKTTAGFTAQQFGVSTDIPTENAFVP